MIVEEDTIVAISTASGRAAIGVVRLSGPLAHDIARRCVTHWPDTPRVATLAEVRDPVSGSTVDQAVIVRYDGPIPVIEMSGISHAAELCVFDPQGI